MKTLRERKETMRIKLIQKGKVYLTPDLKELSYDELQKSHPGISNHTCVGLFCGNVLLEIAELECLYDMYDQEIQEEADNCIDEPTGKFDLLENIILKQGYLVKNDQRRMIEHLKKIEDYLNSIADRI